jgi:hypothetical protein
MAKVVAEKALNFFERTKRINISSTHRGEEEKQGRRRTKTTTTTTTTRERKNAEEENQAYRSSKRESETGGKNDARRRLSLNDFFVNLFLLIKEEKRIYAFRFVLV